VNASSPAVTAAEYFSSHLNFELQEIPCYLIFYLVTQKSHVLKQIWYRKKMAIVSGKAALAL